MDMIRRNRVKFGILAMVAVLTLGIAGATIAVAGGFGGYSEASSVEGLKSARGVVYDWANTWDAKNGNRDWLISGEWTLNCQTACTKAKPHQIEFDMGFAMMRESVKEEGNSSHGHTFWNFSATDVNVVETDSTTSLVIDGMIAGSGPIGGAITIKLVKHVNGHFTFFFELSDPPPGNIITTTVGGAVVESKGR